MDTKNLPMYRAIHHDRRNKLMFVWYTDGSRMAYEVHHRFFTPNRGEYGAMPCGMKDIYGKEMYEVITAGDQEYEIKTRHSGPRNHICEADIDFRTRWLQSYYKDMNDVRFDMKDFNVGYLDIEVATTDRFPTAELAERPVNCVTLYVSKRDTYFVFGLGRDIKPETYQRFKDAGLNVSYTCCDDEVVLLNALFATIGASDLDIIMAWNGDWYDFPYLVNRADKLGVNIRQMSRLPVQYKSAYMSERDHVLEIAGTQVIDQMKLFRKFTMSERDSYKLDDVGFDITGERKAPLPDGYHSYKNYWDDYVFYNVQDVKLQVKIEEKKRMLETTIGACSEARVPFGAIFEAKKMLVGFILNFLHSQNLVFPPLKEVDAKTFPGAYVYSTPGYYEWLVSYDYRSMYPSIMMGANVSPEMKVEFPAGYEVPAYRLAELVRSPWTANGTKQVFYRRDAEGIVPAVTRKIFDGRTALKNLMKKAKKNGDKALADYYNMKQNSYKIFGNSLYGLLGNPYFQLYDPDNSASITAFGVELITMTIAELIKWLETELYNDTRYEELFGEKPTLNPAYNGSFTNAYGEVCPNRLSHGDTDSFFVKFDDLYSPFQQFLGKFIEVQIFIGGKLKSKERFDIASGEDQVAKVFTDAINSECSGAWDLLDEENKGKIMFDGYYTSGNIRIIYNRFTLTDYCRALDTAILEAKLDSIMAEYAKKWNYKDNTLFLKREKCIDKAIVTAKKKYICYVQSNEDIKYKTPEFAITGLEIVRSSTTPFGRKYIMKLVTDLLNIRDKFDIKRRYFEIKKEFFDITRSEHIYNIAIPSGVKTDPPKYLDMINMPKGTKIDWRVRSASVWNHLIETDPALKELTLEPIYGGAKVKFIDVHPNKFGISKLAFVGNECPSRVFDYFKPDWDAQWETTFGKSMGRLFEAVGWNSNFERDDRDLINELF